MLNFLKESMKEFKHVAWPTNKETKKYFSIVSWLIASLTVILYVIGTIFYSALFISKDAINPAKLEISGGSSKNLNQKDLDLKLNPTFSTGVSLSAS